MRAKTILLTLLLTYPFGNVQSETQNPGVTVLTDEIVFLYRDPNAELVRVSGDFTDWQRALTMREESGGVFKLHLRIPLKPAIYRYRYQVDGQWIHDPANPQMVEDSFGTPLSIFEVVREVKILRESPKPLSDGRYLFWHRAPEAGEVCLAGDFNNFSPYNLPLSKEERGIWKISITIPPGWHIYRFVVDGKWIPDPENRTWVIDSRGDKYSHFTTW